MVILRRLVFVILALVPILAFGQADQAIISAIDAPDPIVPGNTLTYTVTFQNNGPNPAVNGGLNILFDANFTPTSIVPPAGFSCTPLTQIMSCTSPSFAPGGPVVLTASGTVAPHLNTFPDGTLTSSFSTSGITPDPNPGNNSSGNIVTAYNSPQVDLSILVVDNPDPVFPNGDITYTVDATNSGPDSATSVNFNVFNNGSLKYQSITIPAGWSCPSQPAVGATPTFTCSRATWAPGTSQFIVVVRADPAVLGINDGTVFTGFSVTAMASDETDDSSDNSETEATQYVTPDADVAISVSDSPDPVAPDGNITYTVTVSNNGPDTAPNITLNAFGGNNLRFQSATVPAGWNCTLPPAGTQTPGYSCTLAAGLANGANSVLTFVMQADDALLGINDQTILFGFSANSSVSDPVPGNNSETEQTAYVTPDADVAISVSDSPDPVAPDGNITYTVTVSNNGPDTAPNITLNSFGANNLRFQSATVPAGWNCTLPPAGTQTTGYSCTLAGLANGASSVLTFVMQADDALLGINDQTILFGFSANSSISDPVPANNSETESTQYSTIDANVSITASDSPDPVANGGTLTFTVDALNGGPDAGPNAVVNLVPHPSLVFQSVNAPAGWNCTNPGVGNAGLTQCTKPSMANAETAQFILVTQLLANGAGGTINSSFSISTGAQDPVHANNSVEVFTNWVGQASDLALDKVTLQNSAAQGGTITYTLYTANNGPADVTNVTVTDTLPSQLLFQSLTPPGGWNCTTPAVGTNGTVTCTIALFPNGASAQFTLVTSVAPNATGSISNSATIGGAFNTDPNPGNSGSSSSAVAVAAANADLGVNKTTNSTNAPRGSTISYQITVQNAGPEPAASVVMTDVLPAQLLFQSINAPAGWNCVTPAVGANGTVTCTAATLAAETSAVFTLTVTVAPNATGTVINSASASHSGGDSNPGNGSGAAAALPVPAATADVAASKTSVTTSVTPGQTFSYSIAFTNNGPDAAANPVMTDMLPASLLFQSIAAPAGWNCTTPAVGATGTITCNAATLANAATANFTLTVQVAPGATGTIVNRVIVSSADTDSNPLDSDVNSTPIPVTPAGADLSIVKSTATATTTVGSVFGYTITVTNAGPGNAAAVTVNDTLPAGLELVSATPSQGSCNGASPIVCNLGGLASGASATIALQVRATATGNIVNTATVTAAEDTATGNNSDDAPIVVITAAPGEENIPTLSEWALIALMGMLAVAAAMRMRT